MVSGIFVAGGLALLFLGGDFLVRGAVSLAQRLEIPTLVIGVTVIAFGTSLPELMVSVEAALDGVPEIAIGNVVGSNIANILLVLGLPAIIAPLHSDSGPILRNTAIMIFASLLMLLWAWNGVIEFHEGLISLALLLAFLWTSYRMSRRDAMLAADYAEELTQFAAPSHSPLLLTGFIVGGLAALLIGSEMLISGAVEIATVLGVSDAVIGLTLVAFGTSLPELVTSLVAVARKHGDVAIGNILGSNLFNILGVMGITAMLVPVPVSDRLLAVDFPVMIVVALAILPFVVRWIDMSRIAGIVFLGAYIVYIWFQFSGYSGLGATP